jgi:hypothetical protein
MLGARPCGVASLDLFSSARPSAPVTLFPGQAPGVKPRYKGALGRVEVAHINLPPASPELDSMVDISPRCAFYSKELESKMLHRGYEKRVNDSSCMVTSAFRFHAAVSTSTVRHVGTRLLTMAWS